MKNNKTTSNIKNFALIGVAGYIAPRHLQAIKETGSNLLAALDLHDSVGILDSYFPEAKFFTEFERFDRHLDKLKRETNQKIDFVTICSPNYLHDAHVRFALRIGADAICEKPLVLNPWNLDALAKLAKESKKSIYTMLQLRLHPALIQLKKKLQNEPKGKKHEITLTYITSRGSWYLHSWKGDNDKSGGIATNIGVHFFDMLIWLFGEVTKNEIHYSSPEKICVDLELQNANVKWFLSVDSNDLPKEAINKKMRTYRSILLDDKEIEFSEGFTDLHTQMYKSILAGKGFGPEDSRPSIALVSDIRNIVPTGIKKNSHPFALKLK